MSVEVSGATSPEMLLTAPTGNQSHLGHLDLGEERHGDGANFCAFIAGKDGVSE